jgi:Ca-activated chloride channel family protein
MYLKGSLGSVLIALGVMGAVKKPVARSAEAVAGALTAVTRDGEARGACPLKRTDVRVDVAGPVARVVAAQEYENPFDEAIEAVYTFPLGANSAVDDMTMAIGERVVKGVVKERGEARRIFEEARRLGQLAGLLDQERPNIFTQAVTNIPPGARVRIEIRYVEPLSYESGRYAFKFPMVVGPRYIPKAGVADADRISPPVTPKGTRAGHDISIAMRIDAGVALESVASGSHEIDVSRASAHAVELKLRNAAEIPNRDFEVNWDVAGRKIGDALLTHRDARGGFFTFLLTPPGRVLESESTPKEIVFVLDTSGSMDGFPIEKSKEVIKLAMDGLRERDTFNLITFAGDTHVLFPQPAPATPENVGRAQRFLLSRRGSGGTEMMKAVRAALAPSASREHVRVVCFLTDGYVGDDAGIIAEVKRHPEARVFSFGIGDAVNHFLLDKMAEESRGEVEYVSTRDDGSAAARRFHERVRTPVLTDVEIDWGGLAVSDVYPQRLPDLFSAKPVVVKGRYTGTGEGVIRLKGRQAGRAFVREIRVKLGSEAGNEALASLWARAKVDALMSRDWAGVHRGTAPEELKAEIVKLGVAYRLMTPYTSFVAVEERVVTEGGKPRRVQVPVEMPSGVSYQGVFGDAERGKFMAASPMAGMTLGRGTYMRREVLTAPAPPRETKPASPKLDPALAGRTGAVKVKVWLSDASPSVIESLKQAGLTVTAHKPGEKLVYGTVDAAKLGGLSKLGGVTYVSLDPGTPAK